VISSGQQSKNMKALVNQGLEANGIDPSLREKLMLFGQFIGDWDIDESRYEGRWNLG
jgi:hypothetical protein